MAACVATLTKEQHMLFEQLYDAVDEDGNGKIDLDELSELHKAVTGFTGPASAMLPHARKQMRSMDIAKDKHVSLTEFKTFLVPLSTSVSKVDLREILQVYIRRLKANQYQKLCQRARQMRAKGQLPPVKKWLSPIMPTATTPSVLGGRGTAAATVAPAGGAGKSSKVPKLQPLSEHSSTSQLPRLSEQQQQQQQHLYQQPTSAFKATLKKIPSLKVYIRRGPSHRHQQHSRQGGTSRKRRVAPHLKHLRGGRQQVTGKAMEVAKTRARFYW